MTVRGHHLTDDRRAMLDTLLLGGASYKAPRLAGYSQSTITAHRHRLGMTGPAKRGRAAEQSAETPPSESGTYRPCGSAADRSLGRWSWPA